VEVINGCLLIAGRMEGWKIIGRPRRTLLDWKMKEDYRKLKPDNVMNGGITEVWHYHM